MAHKLVDLVRGDPAGAVPAQDDSGSKRFTLALAARNGVTPLQLWLPVEYIGPGDPAARGQLSDSTVDLGGALADRPDLFIDGSHTNEEGAGLMAEEMWKTFEPEVRAWYEENG